MADPITLTLLFLLLGGLAAGTESGRAAIGNAGRSAYQATGWRTPGKAAAHHAGTIGAHAGKVTAAAARWARRHGTRAAVTGARAAGKAARAAGRALVPQEIWSRHPGGTGITLPARVTPPAPAEQARLTRQTSAALLHRASTTVATTDPAAGARPPSLSARPRAERSTAMRNRYTINLEMPSSDAEFLESCVHLGDVLKNIAEEIEEWASSLSGLNLPSSVIQPLDSIAEGLVEAAGGASQAAKSFEDEFEDAREVASRGMTITGQDAA